MLNRSIFVLSLAIALSACRGDTGQTPTGIIETGDPGTEDPGTGTDSGSDSETDSGTGTIVDDDGDGYPAGTGVDDDCDDGDPNVNPAASEVCDDTIDNDCDGAVDTNDADCTSQASSAPEGFAFCAAGGPVSGATVSGRLCMGPMDVGASGTIVGADATWQAGPIYVLAP